VPLSTQALAAGRRRGLARTIATVHDTTFFRSKRRVAALLVATLALAGLAALAATGPTRAASHTVAVVDFEYQPQTLTIAAGDDIRWENTSNRQHTVTADNGTFDSGPFVRDEPFSVVFETAGTFAYHCTIHPDRMKGTIVVTAAPPTPVHSGTPAPTPPAGTLPPNFSPFPSVGPAETSPPPTRAPTLSPTASPSAGTTDGGTDPPYLVLALIGIAVLGVIALVVGRRARHTQP
jgi:plastocyanin